MQRQGQQPLPLHRRALHLDIVNLALVIAVALPASCVTHYAFTSCNSSTQPFASLQQALHPPSYTLCRVALHHPLLYTNIVFFFNVCVLFWLISLLQNSTWLIDPYWTLIPPMIGAYYKWHPLSTPHPLRDQAAWLLLLVWSVRLTHSYLRREGWHLGEREDWRFSEMREDNPQSWWFKSFFLAYVSQQVMLVGLCLPLWAIYFDSSGKQFDLLDTVACIGAATGLVIAYFADTQLYNFVKENDELKVAGKKPPLLLYRGLWKFSRHPNYLGEQVFWWSIGLFGVSVGQSWTLVGAAFNSYVLWEVTGMTEKRMLTRADRAEAYRQYQKATSMWLLLLPGRVDKKFYEVQDGAHKVA